MTIIALIIAIALLAVEIPVFAHGHQEEDLFVILGAGLMLILILGYMFWKI